jgi:hypothetical protein
MRPAGFLHLIGLLNFGRDDGSVGIRLRSLNRYRSESIDTAEAVEITAAKGGRYERPTPRRSDERSTIPVPIIATDS